jgi:hypothetical protein
MRLDDVVFLERWDEDPEVAASGGNDDCTTGHSSWGAASSRGASS